jgi:sugar phosphate isomerase/epimerase
MNKCVKLGMALLVVGTCVYVGRASGAETKDQWRLGAQSYSFNRFTFQEAMAKNKACGMKYIEVFPDQKIGEGFGNTVFKNMTPEQRLQVKQMLKDNGLTLTCYGVITPGSEQEWRKLFDFAKDMGFETIVSEPPESAFGLLDKLCEEYKIGIAIHNHPRTSGAHYWNYETVLKACEGHSKWIGACADTGHWTRSDIDPLAAILALGRAGRIRSLHFKDLNKFGPDAHDVPWGTGVSKPREILVALAAFGFDGPFSAEYEYHWDNSVPEIRQSAEWFKKTAAELSSVPAKDVFQKDLSNAVMPPNGWAFDADGVLSPGGSGHGDIWTKEKYGNFVLDLDWKIPEKGNSGVFIRTGSIENWINTAIEVQIHATTDGTPKGQCGAIYDCLSPSKDATRKPGEWNHYTITCLDNKIYVNLNGVDIIDMDLDQWTEAHKNPDGTRNKFTTAYKDMARVGHLGFQYHGNPVWFRNLTIKSFD